MDLIAEIFSKPFGMVFSNTQLFSEDYSVESNGNDIINQQSKSGVLLRDTSSSQLSCLESILPLQFYYINWHWEKVDKHRATSGKHIYLS